MSGTQRAGERSRTELLQSVPAPPAPRSAPAAQQEVLRYDDIPTELAEAIRGIVNRYELRFGDLPSTIAVASALGHEGATTVSQALATIVAQETGKFVCWIDCSWLAAGEMTDREARPRLVDILADHSRIGSAFRSSPELPQLVSLSPGPVSESERNRIVRSPEFSGLIDILCDEFDHVVFDLPPLLAHANALALVRLSDASLLVVRHRSTSLSQVRRAIEAIDPTPNLGIVLNRFRPRIPSSIRRLIGE